jgi:hypothetical protein
MLIAGIALMLGFEPKYVHNSGNGTNTNNHYCPDRDKCQPLVLYLKNIAIEGYCSYHE